MAFMNAEGEFAMKRAIFLVFVVLLSLPGLLSAQVEQANSIQQAILGTWKLVSYIREDLASGAKSDVMGDHASGFLNYGADGRMIVIIAGSDRKKPAGAIATPPEAQALITSMLSYAGTYTIDSEAKTVTHHIDISWDQARTGTENVRRYELTGNRLTLTTEPSIDPATGQKTVRTLIWEKLK
jgi:hypothetical protein